MARRAEIYTIDLRWDKPKQVTPLEFAEFKTRIRLFQFVGKKRLRLRPNYAAWIEGEELRFRQTDGLFRVEFSIPPSWRAVERARIYASKGIREAEERQRQIQQDNGPQTVANQFTIPDVESFGTLAEKRAGD